MKEDIPAIEMRKYSKPANKVVLKHLFSHYFDYIGIPKKDQQQEIKDFFAGFFDKDYEEIVDELKEKRILIKDPNDFINTIDTYNLYYIKTKIKEELEAQETEQKELNKKREILRRKRNNPNKSAPYSLYVELNNIIKEFREAIKSEERRLGKQISTTSPLTYEQRKKIGAFVNDQEKQILTNLSLLNLPEVFFKTRRLNEIEEHYKSVVRKIEPYEEKQNKINDLEEELSRANAIKLKGELLGAKIALEYIENRMQEEYNATNEKYTKEIGGIYENPWERYLDMLTIESIRHQKEQEKGLQPEASLQEKLKYLKEMLIPKEEDTNIELINKVQITRDLISSHIQKSFFGNWNKYITIANNKVYSVFYQLPQSEEKREKDYIDELCNQRDLDSENSYLFQITKPEIIANLKISCDILNLLYTRNFENSYDCTKKIDAICRNQRIKFFEKNAVYPEKMPSIKDSGESGQTYKR